MSAGSPDTRRRVKLYVSNASRQWDDKGTGHVTSCYHEPLDGMSLLVRNELDGSLLLESKIQVDTQYQKQQGTLIVWTESDNYDLALSFLEQDGCNEIWEKICQVQGRNPSYDQDNDEEQEEVRIQLVDCDYDKLHLILEQIAAFSQTTKRKDVLASEYIESDYIVKLLNLFKQAEEREDLEALHKLYEIFKQLFLYDRPTLTEVMTAETIILDVIGVFEYEPPPSEHNSDSPATETSPVAVTNPIEGSPPQESSIDEDCSEKEDSSTSTTKAQSSEPIVDESPPTEVPLNDETSVMETQPTELPFADDVSSTGDKQTIEGKPTNGELVPDDQPHQNEKHQPEKEEEEVDEEKEKEPEINDQGEQQEESRRMQDVEEEEEHHEVEEQHHEVEEQQSQNHQADQPLDQHRQPEQNNLPPTHTRKEHREFLRNGTTFKEVIPFGNQKLVDKIHQTYRVQYLQTSVLPPSSFLEDNAYSSLTNILFFNKVEIVTMIQEDVDFLQNLFNQIISSETSLERKRELVQFLREYCMFSQTIQPKQRECFFKILASLKILSAVEVALSSNDQIIKSAAIDIFTYLVEYSPHMTREHAVQQREGLIDPPNSNAQTANILKLVIEHITTDQDPELGTATQLACIIRLLLDPDNMPSDANGKHLFLEFFYYTCIQSLVEPIKNSTTSESDIQPSANDRKTAQLLSIMLELLTFFTEHHYTQLRNYIVSSDLLKRITSLIKSRHKFLVLSVVRFFRRLVAAKDCIYFDLIIKESLFTPIIQVLKNNNGRYNLVDSAILEMFEFILNEDLIPLIHHVVTEFGPVLDNFNYVNTFKLMKQKKEARHDAITKDVSIRPNNKSDMENPQMYFGNHSRREMGNMWFESIEADDANDVGDLDPIRTDPASNPDYDPDSGDTSVDSDSDGLNAPDLEFTMNGTKSDEEKNDIEEEDGRVEEEEDMVDEDGMVDEDEDIQMNDDDCENELEPQLKRKKTIE